MNVSVNLAKICPNWAQGVDHIDRRRLDQRPPLRNYLCLLIGTVCWFSKL